MALENFSVELELQLTKFLENIGQASASLTDLAGKATSVAQDMTEAFQKASLAGFSTELTKVAAEFATLRESGKTALEGLTASSKEAKAPLEEVSSVLHSGLVDGIRIVKLEFDKAGNQISTFARDVSNGLLAVSLGAKAFAASGKLSADGMVELSLRAADLTAKEELLTAATLQAGQALRTLFGSVSRESRVVQDSFVSLTGSVEGVDAGLAAFRANMAGTSGEVAKSKTTFGDFNSSLLLLDIGLSRSLETLPGIGEAYRGLSAILFSITPIISQLGPDLEKIAQQTFLSGTAAESAASGQTQLVAILGAVQIAVAALVASLLNQLADKLLSIANASAQSAGQLQLFQSVVANALIRANEVTHDTTGTLEEFNQTISDTSQKFGVAQVDITKTTARLLELQPSLKLSGDQLKQLIQIVSALGLQFHDQGRVLTDVADAFEKLPLPIRRLIGADVTAAATQKELTEIMKRGGDEAERLTHLTDEEQRVQAVFNIILKASTPYLNAFEQAEGNVVIATGRLTASLTDLQNRFGQFAGEILAPAISRVSDFVRAITSLPDVFFRVAAALTIFGAGISKAISLIIEGGLVIGTFVGGIAFLNAALASQLPLLAGFRLALETLFAAITGGEVAINSVSSLLRAFGQALLVPISGIGSFVAGLIGPIGIVIAAAAVAAALLTLVEKYNLLNPAIQEETKLLGAQVSMFGDLTDGIDRYAKRLGSFLSNEWSEFLQTSGQFLSDASGIPGYYLDSTTGATELAAALDNLHGPLLSTDEANRRVADSFVKQTKAMKDNIALYGESKVLIDIQTKAIQDQIKVEQEQQKINVAGSKQTTDSLIVDIQRRAKSDLEAKEQIAAAEQKHSSNVVRLALDTFHNVEAILAKQRDAELDDIKTTEDAGKHKGKSKIQIESETNAKFAQLRQQNLDGVLATLNKELEAQQSREAKNLAAVREADEQIRLLKQDTSDKLFEITIRQNEAILDGYKESGAERIDTEKRIDELIVKAKQAVQDKDFELAKKIASNAEQLSGKLTALSDAGSTHVFAKQREVLNSVEAINVAAVNGVKKAQQEEADQAKIAIDIIKSKLSEVSSKMVEVLQQLQGARFDITTKILADDSPVRKALAELAKSVIIIPVHLDFGGGGGAAVTGIQKDLDSAPPLHVPAEISTIDIKGGSIHSLDEAAVVISHILTPINPVDIALALSTVNFGGGGGGGAGAGGGFPLDTAKEQIVRVLTPDGVPVPLIISEVDLKGLGKVPVDQAKTAISTAVTPPQPVHIEVDVPTVKVGGNITPIEQVGPVLAKAITPTESPKVEIQVSDIKIGSTPTPIERAADDIVKVLTSPVPAKAEVQVSDIKIGSTPTPIERAADDIVKVLTSPVPAKVALALSDIDVGGSKFPLASAGPAILRVLTPLTPVEFNGEFAGIDINGNLVSLRDAAGVLHETLTPPPIEPHLQDGTYELKGVGTFTIGEASKAIADTLTPKQPVVVPVAIDENVDVPEGSLHKMGEVGTVLTNILKPKQPLDVPIRIDHEGINQGIAALQQLGLSTGQANEAMNILSSQGIAAAITALEKFGLSEKDATEAAQSLTSALSQQDKEAAKDAMSFEELAASHKKSNEAALNGAVAAFNQQRAFGALLGAARDYGLLTDKLSQQLGLLASYDVSAAISAVEGLITGAHKAKDAFSALAQGGITDLNLLRSSIGEVQQAGIDLANHLREVSAIPKILQIGVQRSISDFQNAVTEAFREIDSGNGIAIQHGIEDLRRLVNEANKAGIAISDALKTRLESLNIKIDVTPKIVGLDIPGASVHPLEQAGQVIHEVIQKGSNHSGDVNIFLKTNTDPVFTAFERVYQYISQTPIPVTLHARRIDISGGSMHDLADAAEVIQRVITPKTVEARLKTSGFGSNGGHITIDINMGGEQYPVTVADHKSAQNLVQFTQQLRTATRSHGDFVSPYEQ